MRNNWYRTCQTAFHSMYKTNIHISLTLHSAHILPLLLLYLFGDKFSYTHSNNLMARLPERVQHVNADGLMWMDFHGLRPARQKNATNFVLSNSVLYLNCVCVGFFHLFFVMFCVPVKLSVVRATSCWFTGAFNKCYFISIESGNTIEKLVPNRFPFVSDIWLVYSRNNSNFAWCSLFFPFLFVVKWEREEVKKNENWNPWPCSITIKMNGWMMAKSFKIRNSINIY